MVENPAYPDFPYHFSGTCFLVERKKKRYLVTARHCVDEVSKNNLFVLKNLKSRECIGLTMSYRPRALHHRGEILEDVNQLDVVVFDVDVNSYSDVCPLQFDDNKFPSLNPADEVFSLGYPKQHNTIDYDASHIKLRQRCYVGLYSGQEDDFTHIAKLEIEGDLLDGASGSPVFSGTPDKFRFVGMLTRADERSRTGKVAYLGAAVIAGVIDHSDGSKA